MADFSKVMIAKIAWSEAYSGGTVYGRHGYLKEKSKKRIHTRNGKTYFEAMGHETYNFLPFDKRCYGYIPPIGEDFVPPNPTDPKGWLVIFVAPYMGYGNYVAVGWYENAIFEWNTKNGIRKYKKRPHDKNFPKDEENKNFTYCLSTNEKDAHLIKSSFRPLYTVKGEAAKHLGRTCIYLEGQKSVLEHRHRIKLMSFVKKVVEYDDTKATEKIEISDKVLNGFCPPSTEAKKEIEDEAIRRAITHYKKDYKVKSVEHENLGWDLTITHRKTGEKLYIEVKGTKRPTYHFFLSHNEFGAMIKHPKKWILFIVKDIGQNTDSPPKILNATEAEIALAPFTYEGEYPPKKRR